MGLGRFGNIYICLVSRLTYQAFTVDFHFCPSATFEHTGHRFPSDVHQRVVLANVLTGIRHT
uniref:Uncharacterized protein n=1 Tax=Arion vulgaris TaxID=1028688 RepID=A0A0B7BKK5_9EUPU